MKKRIILLVLCLVFVFSALLCVALAADMSISVELFDGEIAVSGARVNIYKVNDPGSLDSEMAEKLADLAAENSIEPTDSVVTDTGGRARIGGLGEGIYLVVVENTAKGDYVYSTKPFLLQLPMEDESTGELVYAVTAKPKISCDDIPETEPEIPDTGEKLPQTGMLWWPVAVLAGIGVMLMVFGAAKREKIRRER